jgi:DNA-binding winged helix-turn-helix (wHTH) protein/tetratricopeptide (TPR) repeat protein
VSGRFYNFGPFQLDTEEQVLLRDGRPLSLQPKVFDLLVVLVENSGHVLTKNELMRVVWADSFVEEGNLAVSIHEIRKVLGGKEDGNGYIETVPRRGYRFAACVTGTSRDTQRQISSDAAESSEEGERLLTAIKGTIAVLPFKPIGNSADEYLGLGITDALITRLSTLRQVTVRPTSTVLKYVMVNDPVAAGSELRVNWVLDGSVQKAGKRIRLTVQLIHVEDGVLQWAEKFDEKFTDIFNVEDSISEQVARALESQLTGEDRRLLTKRYTENPQAYEAYLKGRCLLEKRTTNGCKMGIEFFKRAIEIDPNYALAYAGVAASYISLSTILPSPECIPMAEQSSLRALELDAELAEAQTSLGYVKVRQWQWSAAESQFKTAIQINPNYPTARAAFAIYLAEMGRFGHAIEEIRNARLLDPISPIINAQVGSVLYLARQYKRALDHFRNGIGPEPEFPLAHFILGYILEALGEYDQAVTEYQRSQTELGNRAEFIACVGRINALTKNREQALAAIANLIQLSSMQYVQPTLIALIHASLGDKDSAFHWLEKAYAERDEDLCLLKVDPRLDSLREDRRYTSLLIRVGLTS